MASEQYIWVIAHNGGCEGHSPPLQAFSSEDDARASLRLLALPADGNFDLFKVPVWPNTVGNPFPTPEPA